MLNQGVAMAVTPWELFDHIEDIAKQIDLHVQVIGNQGMREFRIAELFMNGLGRRELNVFEIKPQAVYPGFNVRELVF